MDGAYARPQKGPSDIADILTPAYNDGRDNLAQPQGGGALAIAGAVSGPVAMVVGTKEEDRVEDVAGTYGRKEVGQMANNLGRRQSASDRRSWSIVSLI